MAIVEIKDLVCLIYTAQVVHGEVDRFSIFFD